jgi:N-acetylglucosamine-6-phosphate deacetylase
MTFGRGPERVVTGRDPRTGQRLDVTLAETGIVELRRSIDRSADLPWLTPGLVDLQVNGYAGHDVNGSEASVEGVLAITAALAACGVTTWIPTVITAEEAAIRNSLEIVERARRSDPPVAAAIPSVHVEGPFISPLEGARGVHDPAQIRPLDVAEVARWCAEGAAPLGILTLSPHDDATIAAIPAVRELGIAVSIGHTHADADHVRAAVDAGATLSTHLGNGMPAMIPRHPNAIWAQLADDRLTCGLIADGHHLPSDTLEVMLRAKGPGGAFLVSDATALAGLPSGRYRTAVGGEVQLDEDGRLSSVESGYLAGAATNLAEGLRHVLSATTLSLPHALALVTENPARGLRGARRGLGTLSVAAPADLVLLDDRAAVLSVFRGGRELGA